MCRILWSSKRRRTTEGSCRFSNHFPNHQIVSLQPQTASLLALLFASMAALLRPGPWTHRDRISGEVWGLGRSMASLNCVFESPIWTWSWDNYDHWSCGYGSRAIKCYQMLKWYIIQDTIFRGWTSINWMWTLMGLMVFFSTHSIWHMLFVGETPLTQNSVPQAFPTKKLEHFIDLLCLFQGIFFRFNVVKNHNYISFQIISVKSPKLHHQFLVFAKWWFPAIGVTPVIIHF